MLALTQCWFTRMHVPSHAGRRDGGGVLRSECRHCDRPIISWDKQAWHLAEGFNLLSVYQGIEKPFLYLIDTRNDFVVARFPIDHLEFEGEVEAFAEQICAENGVNDPDSALALRDSRKRKFPRKPPIRNGAIAVNLLPSTGIPSRDADKLTGLPGRGSFEAVFESECAAALGGEAGLSIAFVDPDRLDRLNRAKGLDAGDALIRQVAERLARVADGWLHLSRNRGLEFLLLSQARADGLALGLARACNDLAGSGAFTVDGKAPGLSCGVAAVPVTGDPRTALRAADVALHEAKARGGSCVVRGTQDG